jgi:peptidoglycan hydrolase-like protein with peptidoglycan-binding domain
MSELLKKGSKGAAVVNLQQSLQRLGFTLEADGQFGDITHNVVVAVQAIFGYDIDGMVGPATAKLINQQLGYGWNLELARKGGYPQQSQNQGSV